MPRCPLPLYNYSPSRKVQTWDLECRTFGKTLSRKALRLKFAHLDHVRTSPQMYLEISIVSDTLGTSKHSTSNNHFKMPHDETEKVSQSEFWPWAPASCLLMNDRCFPDCRRWLLESTNRVVRVVQKPLCESTFWNVSWILNFVPRGKISHQNSNVSVKESFRLERPKPKRLCYKTILNSSLVLGVAACSSADSIDSRTIASLRQKQQPLARNIWVDPLVRMTWRLENCILKIVPHTCKACCTRFRATLD